MALTSRQKALLKQSRRSLIARTAKIWSRLGRELNKELKAVAQAWFTRVLKAAERGIDTGTLTDVPAMPEKATKLVWDTVRAALAQGYWLQHVYMREAEAASRGGTYRGKVTLSDTDSDDVLRDALESFINSRRVNVSSEWHSVIPQSAVDWLKGYTPTLMGVVEQDVLTAVRDVIRQSMLEGKTLSQRMDDLKAASPKIAAMIDRRVEMIARTEVTRADSMGRLMEMKNNPDVVGFEFCAILDDRTSQICSERNGFQIARDDISTLVACSPPLHVNCRSLLAPVSRYEKPVLETSPELDTVMEGKQRETDIQAIRDLLGATTESGQGETDTPSTPADWLKNLEAQLKSGAFWSQQAQNQETQPAAAVNSTGDYVAPAKPTDTIRGVSKKEIDRLRGTRGHMEEGTLTAEQIVADYRAVGIALAPEDAQATRDALSDFVQGAHLRMHEAFLAYRQGQSVTDQAALDNFLRITEYVRIAPTFEGSGKELYRGIRSSDYSYVQRLMALKPGDPFDLEMTSSFSSSLVRALDFTNYEGFILHIPNSGLKDAVSVRGVVDFGDVEEEVLVDERKWIVEQVRDETEDGIGIYHIWLKRAGN